MGAPVRRVRDEALDEVVRREVVDAGVAPVGAVGLGTRGGEAGAGWVLRVGASATPSGDGLPARGREALHEAVFDLASLSKPLTALVAARAVVAGTSSFEETVAERLPSLAGTPAADARLVDLLTHRAGMPAWGALYRGDPFGDGRPAPQTASVGPDGPLPDLPTMLARAASRRTPPSPASPDSCHELYSDLGYVLAGAMLATGTGRRLDEGWAALPGGATSAARRRLHDPTFDARVVPTEVVPWRGGLLRGVVHDENAWALERAGGDPGHAGAFGTVDEVAAVAMAFVDALDGRPGALLPAAISAWMTEPRAGGSHRVGWDGRTEGASSSGRHFGPRTFGHLGFTGTSVWADPDARVVVVLLTNRVHPSRDRLGIREARPRVHDALWALL